MDDWLTPTPRPILEATPPLEIPTDGMFADMAEEAVQWWWQFSDFTDLVILALILIIIIGGGVMILRQVRTL